MPVWFCDARLDIEASDVAQDAVLRVSGRGRTPIWSSDAVTR